VPRDLESKTALVTGSGRNIGRAIVLEFASRGANVVVNSRTNAAQAKSVAAEARALGVGAVAVTGDVSQERTIERIAHRCEAAFGHGPDIYVSNSAARPVRTLAEVTPDEWQSIVNVQLHACYLLARAFAPGMVQRGWGRIIHITGPSAFLGVPHRPHVAAKGAIRGLTKSLAVELGPHGITVNDVAPGEIAAVDDQPSLPGGGAAAPDPRRMAGAPIAVGRVGRPEDIAYACGFLASPRAGFYSGTVIVCSGGQWTAL
jgi:3-oxoacyl-[acyl-carrier protein] reductase